MRARQAMLRNKMLRLAVALAFAIGCSKATHEEKPSPSPSPTAVVADAAAETAVAATPDAADAADVSRDAGSEAAGSAAAASAASDFDFDKLEYDDKVAFMKQKVMPTMKPLLVKFDPKEFPKVTCKTCHGKDPKATKYKMPSPDLPKLDFDAIKAGKEDPKVVEFMSKVVKPEMAKLLNKPEMTESNPEGFGCLGCHELKKKK